MAPLSTRQTPEDTVCETPQANHKVFSPQRRREPKEARDLESGLWHATGVSEDSEQQEQGIYEEFLAICHRVVDWLGSLWAAHRADLP